MDRAAAAYLEARGPQEQRVERDDGLRAGRRVLVEVAKPTARLRVRRHRLQGTRDHLWLVLPAATFLRKNFTARDTQWIAPAHQPRGDPHNECSGRRAAPDPVPPEDSPSIKP